MNTDPASEAAGQAGASAGPAIEATGLADASGVLASYADGLATVSEPQRLIEAPVASGARQLAAIVRDLDRAGVLIDDLAVRHPSLNDVFLTLTGRATGPGDGAAALAGAAGKDAA